MTCPVYSSPIVEDMQNLGEVNDDSKLRGKKRLKQKIWWIMMDHDDIDIDDIYTYIYIYDIDDIYIYR